MFKKDHILIGILTGLLIPAIVVGLVYLIFLIGEKTPTMELMGQVVFLGLAANILPARIFSKRKMEMTTRGIMAITMLLVVVWAIQFIIE